MFIGNKGKLMHETYGYRPRLLPQSLHDSYGKPKQTIARIQTTHEMNWVEAAKGKTAASCPFDYAARLVEVMLLGVVSLRARLEDLLRRRQDADHQPAVGERPAPPRIPQRVQAHHLDDLEIWEIGNLEI